jgi:hypothetical protein
MTLRIIFPDFWPFKPRCRLLSRLYRQRLNSNSSTESVPSWNNGRALLEEFISSTPNIGLLRVLISLGEEAYNCYANSLLDVARDGLRIFVNTTIAEATSMATVSTNSMSTAESVCRHRDKNSCHHGERHSYFAVIPHILYHRSCPRIRLSTRNFGLL